MKVIAINGSPNGRNGNTQIILDPFLDGMSDAGADVEVLQIRKLRIMPCNGCFKCWPREGECVIKDDMREIMPRMNEADIWVLATPLYVGGMTGPLKTFVDRLFPTSSPFLEVRHGHSRKRVRQGTKQDGKLVLVASCGLHEPDNFDTLVTHVKEICEIKHRQYAGAVLRPHAALLTVLLKLVSEKLSAGRHVAEDDDPFDIESDTGLSDLLRVRALTMVQSYLRGHLDAAYQAGFDLVARGRMRKGSLRRVSRPLMPMRVYVPFINRKISELIGQMKSEAAA